jgi:hypothetical protein
VKNPAAETAGRQKIEYLFSLSFPLVGNPSDPESFREKILDFDVSSVERQARMTEQGTAAETAGCKIYKIILQIDSDH